MSIRTRLALAFGSAAAVLLAVGGWVFVSLLSSSMLGSIDTQLATAAGLAARYVVPGGDGGSPSAQLPGEFLVQVVDASGRVTAAGPDAGSTPLVRGATLAQATTDRVTLTRVLDGEPTRIVAEPYSRHGSVAVAADPLDSYDQSVATLERSVVLGGIAVLAVAVAGSYLLARRALAPVERMRRQAQALTEADDTARIPVPATRDELATLARTMNDLLGRLHESLARQRRFVADASHELRSPLAVLEGELELAGRPGRTRDQMADAVASAAEEAARLTRLTGELLLLARNDSGSLGLRPEPVDVTSLLRRVAEAGGRRAANAGVQLSVASPDGLTAMLDAVPVRQAVDNLVDNALRYAPRGSSIELRSSVQGPFLVIEVLDRGPGFPEEYLPHAFERFTRPSGERSRSDGGAGLGLAIVAAIADAHEGRATVANRSGGGAAIRLELPCGPVLRSNGPDGS